jgi:LmbE family N-acetylglucosaminyl deacetylase
MNPPLFLAPHNDDETLFGAFTIQRERCRVVTVLRSYYQAQRWPGANAATFERRENETLQALNALGVPFFEQWTHDDRNPDWAVIGEQLGSLDADERYPKVYAPFPEQHDGHEHHDLLGRLAVAVFGRDRVTFYTTYQREQGRSTVGHRVDPTAGEIAGKLRALACYTSQLENWLCRPHFTRGIDEFLVSA